MVKQAVKEKKQHPLLPVAGLILVLGLGVVSYLLVEFLLQNDVGGIKGMLSGAGSNFNLAKIAFTVILWLVMTTIGYFIVALMVGKDPDPMSAQNIPMRPRTIKKK